MGAVLVSTCFRVELLVSGPRPAPDLLAWGREQLAEARPEAPLAIFRHATGDAALRHLLRVAGGLEGRVGRLRRAREVLATVLEGLTTDRALLESTTAGFDDWIVDVRALLDG